MAKTKTRSVEFAGSGFIVFLPNFTPDFGDPFDGYLAGDIIPEGNFPRREIYATPEKDKALEMSERCAQEWLRDHPRWIRKGAKILSISV
jgi:hypothetical protein